MTCLLCANRDISTWLPQHTLFGRVRSSTVRLSSTLERVPELLNLLWGQLLAPAHNAQHLFALDLALPFASRLSFSRARNRPGSRRASSRVRGAGRWWRGRPREPPR